MKTFKYCIMTMVYKKKMFHAFVFSWVLALLIVLFQFSGYSEIAETGTVYTSYFVVSFKHIFIQILLQLTPLFGAYLYGDICIEENEFQSILFMRTSRMKLNICNMFISFISAFLIMLFFLLITLFFTYFILQSDSTIIFKQNYFWNPSLMESFVEGTPLASMMYNDPLSRIMIYISLISVYSGLGGLVTYAFSLFVKNKSVIYIASFAFFTLMSIITSFFKSNLYLQDLLYPYIATYDGSVVIRNACMIMLLYGVVFSLLCIIKSKVEDTTWKS